VRVGRAFRLGKHVGDAHALKHGTHCAAGLHSRTFRSRLEKHTCASELGFLLVGDGALVHGNADEVLLGALHAFGDGSLHLVGFAETPAYNAVLIAHDHYGRETERTSALSNLGYAVDGHKTVFQFKIIRRFYSVVSFCHDSS
jgi:hypothetical protein